MKKLDVCLSLKLIDNYDLNDTSIVIIDVVRASTTITTALYYGIEHIVAHEDIEETRQLKKQGYIIAGERNGDKIEGFDFGNSPLSFTSREFLEGKKLAITTTNGTRTLGIAERACSNSCNCKILIGTFVNFDSIKNYLLANSQNILLLCSGWKANLSIEDTIFAGKLAADLLKSGSYQLMSDGASHAMHLYNIAQNNLFDFVLDNSARFRGKPGNLIQDIRYCLRENLIDTIPVLKDGKIFAIKP